MQKNPGCGEVGAFPGFGGSFGSGGCSPGADGLPRIPVVQAPGGSRGGEGTGGSSEMRGQRQAQLRGAGFVGEKKEEKGNLGAFLDCFWFAVVGIGAGNSAPRLSPKEGMGDLGSGLWQGKPSIPTGRGSVN